MARSSIGWSTSATSNIKGNRAENLRKSRVMLSSKAMSNRFRVSSTLPRKLKELGLSPDTVLRRAGLPMGLFKLDRILVSTEQFFALHQGIAEASNDPAIGLKLGIEERVERYDPVKLASLSSRSFRGAVERSSRYKQL